MDSAVLALLFKMAMMRLPSLENFSCVNLSSGYVMGLSLLAIQTGVKTGILLNHMPIYQPREDKVDLLMIVVPGAGWNWKKPNANLPFFDMSFSPTISV